jgi:hypothetical protein
MKQDLFFLDKSLNQVYLLLNWSNRFIANKHTEVVVVLIRLEALVRTVVVFDQRLFCLNEGVVQRHR